MSALWPLVGRDAELQFIAEGLNGPTTRGVVLVGAPGVGKTRLAGEAADVARAGGLAAVWIAATMATSEIPFGAMAPLMSRADAHPADSFRSLADGGGLLGAAADGKQLVLCVDDAHFLDPLSAALVHQVVTADAVRLLATVRRGQPVPDELTSLWKDGRIERLEITGLSRPETDALVALVLGGPVHGATADRLWRITEGNTLFLRELIVAARAAGDLTERDGIWCLDGRLEPGPRLIDLVGLRLGSLTPSQERVIEYVALAEPVDAEILAAITSAADLEDTERTGAITAFADGGRLRIRLAHPLYGEVIRGGVPPLRARGMLCDLADALEARGVERPDEILAMATWRLDSGGQCSLDVLLAASGQARGHFDYVLAERLAHAAVERYGGIDASRTRAECLYMNGRFADADAELATLDGVDGSDRQLADVAIARAANLMWGLGDEEAAERQLSAASRAVVEPGALDDLRALRARVALAGARLHAVFELTAMVLERSDASEPARLSAAVGRAPALALAGRSVGAVELLDEFGPIAWRHVDDIPQGIGMVLVSQVTANWFAGDLDGAAAAAAELYDIGVAVHSAEAVCAGARSRAWVAVASGCPRTAMRWAHEALAAVPEGDVNGLACWCYSVLAEAAAVAEDPGAPAALARMEATRHPSIRNYDAQLAVARAWAAAISGELSRAVAYLLAGAEEARGSGAFAAECHLLHNAVRLDRPHEVVSRLVELAGLIDGPWAAAFADHAVALDGHDAGQLDRVATDFAGLGATLLAAEAAMQAARSYRRGGLERGRRAAATRSSAWAAQCERARTPALAAPEAIVQLTPREHEIAALAGRGLSNPEIAARLTLSARTVEGHLLRTYAKLGVNRREDLAAHRVG